jgi:malonyl-CoA O-methyltransferase
MFDNAIRWIKRNAIQSRCVPVSHRKRDPYPEVTGYYIPTLLQIGEHELAENFARFLVSVQNPDGSFSLSGSEGRFVFDTGQIIRGWVSIASRLPEVQEPMRRACEWIIRSADEQTGRFLVPAAGSMWSLGERGEVNEGIHLYVIQPLREAAKILNTSHIRDAADRALNFYLRNLELTRFDRPNELTHFYGYVQEALVETGHLDRAAEGMGSVAQFQQANGLVPAYHDVGWVCTPGLAQLAKVWFLLGQADRAYGALNAMRLFQNYTGGFYGSYGVGAEYFPADEIPWAVKYFIDAELLAIQSHFTKTSIQYSPLISPEDGRAQAVLAACWGAKRILDAGCGKGRYAALVKSNFPQSEVYAVDISEEMLASVPAGIEKRRASIQDMPFRDQEFDVVYCVEALEHVPNPHAALKEMTRVLRSGGELVIIDKNIDKLGTLKIERWEKWFGPQDLAKIINELDVACTVSELTYEGRGADGLFLCWQGVKGAPHTGSIEFQNTRGGAE